MGKLNVVNFSMVTESRMLGPDTVEEYSPPNIEEIGEETIAIFEATKSRW